MAHDIWRMKKSHASNEESTYITFGTLHFEKLTPSEPMAF